MLIFHCREVGLFVACCPSPCKNCGSCQTIDCRSFTEARNTAHARAQSKFVLMLNLYYEGTRERFEETAGREEKTKPRKGYRISLFIVTTLYANNCSVALFFVHVNIIVHNPDNKLSTEKLAFVRFSTSVSQGFYGNFVDGFFIQSLMKEIPSPVLAEQKHHTQLTRGRFCKCSCLLMRSLSIPSAFVIAINNGRFPKSAC
jgi:hypothetical protein